MNGNEDPATMRAVAHQLRGEADLICATVGGVTTFVAGMAFAGPAAEKFRQGISDADRRSSGICSGLLDLASRLEQEAYQAELRAAAVRAAGGLA